MDYARRELTKAGCEDTFFTEPKTYDDLYKDIYSTIDPRERPDVEEQWRRHVEEGAPYRPEYRVIRSDDKEVWVSGACRLIADERGRPVRLIGAMQNITERKQAEEALRQAKEDAEAANRAKSAFLAAMSHEIRTPLNGVLGMAQAMAAEDLPKVVRQSGEALLTVLNDVLDLSKIEAGMLQLEETEFDIGELAGGAQAAFAAIADQKPVRFEVSIAPEARGVYRGDCSRVRQILFNLISNALKFTESGLVRVEIERDEAGLDMTVSDTGIGIPADRIPRLFQKFEQVDASMTRRYGGTGLGLAISRELAERLGGSITVTSAEGQGSRFRVRLPLPRLSDSRVGAATDMPAPCEPGEGLNLRVLAAEDNNVNQLVLKTLLQQVGIDPFIVSDGAEAVSAWRSREWDLILMDVQMPVMDGPTATRRIRRREAELGRARTPIFALTANAMSHQVDEYASAGMDGVLAKPIELARLYEVIQSAALAGADPADRAAAA
jgi:signal transduction histidine kinase